MNEFDTTKMNDVVGNETLEKIYAWSKGFQKFVCYPFRESFDKHNWVTEEVVRSIKSYMRCLSI